LAGIFTAFTDQKDFKNFGEKGALAYPGTAEIFSVFPIISGMGKATKFKFGRYIHRVHANKSPLRIWEKRDCWRIQGVPKFSKYPYYLRNA